MHVNEQRFVFEQGLVTTCVDPDAVVSVVVGHKCVLRGVSSLSPVDELNSETNNCYEQNGHGDGLRGSTLVSRRGRNDRLGGLEDASRHKANNNQSQLR